MNELGRFFLTNGVGQNITAAAILAIPTTIWARVKLIPAIRAHHQRVKDLHQALTQDPRSSQ